MNPKITILTGEKKDRFLRLIHSDFKAGTTVIHPFLLITTGKSRSGERMIVAPLQFDERGVKAEFKKLKGSLIEFYLTLPRVEIIQDDPQLGSRTEVYLAEAFKNEPDDIAVGTEFKNGVLWAWVPNGFI